MGLLGGAMEHYSPVCSRMPGGGMPLWVLGSVVGIVITSIRSGNRRAVRRGGAAGGLTSGR
jgi:hypothetical protein